MKEEVILVDENDNEVGVEEKIKAHRNGGKLHRAFSIFIFNSKGELLLQRRAETKYNWPGSWANTCCSHPRLGEKLMAAAHRRLKEEMGFDCNFEKKFDFIYHANLNNNFWEWEFDHVFVGKFDGFPEPNPEEVKEWKWINMEKLKKDIRETPQNYTPWLKIILKKYLKIEKDR